MYERLFTVEEPLGERWALALELFREGTPIVFRNLVLEPGEDEFRVSVISQYTKPTESAARAQLDAAAEAVEALVAQNLDFAEAVASRTLMFELVSDYGMGTARLCYLDVAGALHWL